VLYLGLTTTPKKHKETLSRDVAQPGRAQRSGRWGRWFKSTRPDHIPIITSLFRPAAHAPIRKVLLRVLSFGIRAHFHYLFTFKKVFLIMPCHHPVGCRGLTGDVFSIFKMITRKNSHFLFVKSPSGSRKPN
jgi:hypothetical protein